MKVIKQTFAFSIYEKPRPGFLLPSSPKYVYVYIYKGGVTVGERERWKNSDLRTE